VPEPDGLPTRQERFAAAGIEDTFGPSALDVRYITNDPFNRREPLPPTQRVWFRANGDLPDLDAFLPGGELVDFARDPNGELVALSLGGQVVRIRPA
ncbi:MAG: hypothetical protein EBY44_01755, partial [Actinobacteria bacterium]|nr:hypothetical protein [Actinomycetota bacterium]